MSLAKDFPSGQSQTWDTVVFPPIDLWSAEGGKYPNIIVEILSDSTAEVDRGLKWGAPAKSRRRSNPGRGAIRSLSGTIWRIA